MDGCCNGYRGIKRWEEDKLFEMRRLEVWDSLVRGMSASLEVCVGGGWGVEMESVACLWGGVPELVEGSWIVVSGGWMGGMFAPAQQLLDLEFVALCSAPKGNRRDLGNWEGFVRKNSRYNQVRTSRKYR